MSNEGFTPTTKSLYDIVEALPTYTIFQVRDGAPWLRSAKGVEDLMVLAMFPDSFGVARKTSGYTNGIPAGWKAYAGEDWAVNVIYTASWVEDEL